MQPRGGAARRSCGARRPPPRAATAPRVAPRGEARRRRSGPRACARDARGRNVHALRSARGGPCGDEMRWELEAGTRLVPVGSGSCLEPDAYYLGFDRNWVRSCRGSDCYYALPSAKSARNAAATAAGEGSSGCVPAVPAFRSQRGQRFVRGAVPWRTGAPPSRSPPALSRVAGCSMCGRRQCISRFLYSRLHMRLLTCHGRAYGPVGATSP
jgi:hypothetical protein